jgi:hypothetical protein
MATVEQRLKLMQSADDAWNARDFPTFRQRHTADVDVRVSGAPDTHGIDPHVEVSEGWGTVTAE